MCVITWFQGSYDDGFLVVVQRDLCLEEYSVVTQGRRILGVCFGICTVSLKNAEACHGIHSHEL